MPQFRTGIRAEPQDVAVAIGADGSSARVLPPLDARSDMDIGELELATAMYIAGALADRLGTKVCVLDEGDHIHLIDDDPKMSGLVILS